MGSLPDFYLSNLAFRDIAAQIDFAEIKQRNDSRSGSDYFAGLGRARNDGAAEGRDNGEVFAIGLCFIQLELRFVEY